MSDSRLQELLSAELDGELSTAEQNELQQLLDNAPGAASERRHYAKLDELLHDMPRQLLPAELHHRIASAVRLPQAAEGKAPWYQTLFMRPAFRYGMAVAASVLIAVALFTVGGSQIPQAPTADMLGSMVPQQGSLSGEVLDRLTIKGIDYTSDVTLSQVNQQLVMSVVLHASNPVDIEVDFAQSDVRVDSMTEVKGSLDSVSYANPVLHLTGQGQQRLHIFLRREGNAVAADMAEIQLKFSSAGQALERGSLRPVQKQ